MKVSDGAIRPAQSSEAAALSAIALRSKAYWGYSRDFMDRCREELSYSGNQLASDGYSFQVFEAAEGIRGFYAIEWQQPTIGQTSVGEAHACELEALFVDPPYIGHGIGKALMDHAKSSARERGIHRIIIQGDPNAAKFYCIAGGVHTGDRESGSIAGRSLPVFEIAL